MSSHTASTPRKRQDIILSYCVACFRALEVSWKPPTTPPLHHHLIHKKGWQQHPAFLIATTALLSIFKRD